MAPYRTVQNILLFIKTQLLILFDTGKSSVLPLTKKITLNMLK